jgi:hypothetical protein
MESGTEFHRMPAPRLVPDPASTPSVRQNAKLCAVWKTNYCRTTLFSIVCACDSAAHLPLNRACARPGRQFTPCLFAIRSSMVFCRSRSGCETQEPFSHGPRAITYGAAATYKESAPIGNFCSLANPRKILLSHESGPPAKLTTGKWHRRAKWRRHFGNCRRVAFSGGCRGRQRVNRQRNQKVPIFQRLWTG